MELSRRNFISGCTSAAVATAGLAVRADSAVAPAVRKEGFRWGIYQQQGSHMWNTAVKFPLAENGHYCGETTLIDDGSWERRMAKAAECGMNMMSIDLAEGLVYPSHPELAVQGSRSAEWMNARVRKLRDLGIEAIPCLNFSTAHHFWLGAWSRRVSTPEYYKTVAELLADAYDIFEKPSIMGMGMDEENPDNTAKCVHCLRRQGDLLWHDIDFYARTISKLGARPSMSADYVWWRREDYLKHVSKEIIQDNWYYGVNFDYLNMKRPRRTYVEAYLWLNEAGYDQMPGCGNYLEWYDKEDGLKENVLNVPRTIEFALKHIDSRHLLGIRCSCWSGTSPRGDKSWFDACDQFARAKNSVTRNS